MHTTFKDEETICKRIVFITDGSETISQFVKKAVVERLRRMEARDDRARTQNLAIDVKLLKPIVKEILLEVGLI